MTSIEWTVELRFVVALVLGFLVGLERESAKLDTKHLVFGGVRTHPLISLLGFGCAWLTKVGVTLALPAGLAVLGALTAIAYVTKIRSEHYGTTSEISALLTFVTGALAFSEAIWASMALGVINALLLSEKAKLETFVERLNKTEFLAVLKFLLVTVIILPVLPDQEYTRYRLNPTKIWEVVILVSTIGFVGYFLTKKFGMRVGLWLSGLLGGIVSSTALTVSVGRLARREPERSAEALRAAMLAGSVMYLRVLILVAIFGPSLVSLLWWKLLLLALIGVALAISIKAPVADHRGPDPAELQNPFEITPALVFGAILVVLFVVTEVVRSMLGDAGTIALSLVVGFADVDPFILSLLLAGQAELAVITAAILFALMSNTVAKGVYFGVLAREVRRGTAWRYLVWALLHIPLALAL